MTTQVLAGNVLANGLLADFADTYTTIRNRQADGMLGQVMDLSIGATNRQHEFGYFEAAPHMAYWPRGSTIPTDGMASVKFEVPVYNWGRRVQWHRDDREDDQTQTLTEAAMRAGESAALLPERFFFDLLTNSTDTLPALPLAPDGAAFFATTTPDSAARFGASSGNLLTGNTVATSSAVRSDFYAAIEQFMLFQDGKGQPLFSRETIDQGVILIYGAANTEVMEETFLQKRVGQVLGSDAGTTPSNLVQDASRNVQLWGTQRITDDSFYVFLRAAPKMPTFLLDRQGIQEHTAFEGDNNSDSVRSTKEEYVQWDLRQGAGIALPYGAIKVNNA